SLGNMKVIIEKPKIDVGHMANIGLYYVSDHRALRESLHRIMMGPAIKGEYYFTYALNDMVKNGYPFQVREVDSWDDCGDLNSFLATNQRLLSATNGALPGGYSGIEIIPPVAVDENVELQDCVIGPDVTIRSGTRIR